MSQSIDCVLKGEHERICFMLDVFVLLCECVPLPSQIHTVLVCKQRGVNRGQHKTTMFYSSVYLTLALLPLQSSRCRLSHAQTEEATALHASLLDESRLACFLFERTTREARCTSFTYFFFLPFAFFHKM